MREQELEIEYTEQNLKRKTNHRPGFKKLRIFQKINDRNHLRGRHGPLRPHKVPLHCPCPRTQIRLGPALQKGPRTPPSAGPSPPSGLRTPGSLRFRPPAHPSPHPSARPRRSRPGTRLSPGRSQSCRPGPPPTPEQPIGGGGAWTIGTDGILQPTARDVQPGTLHDRVQVVMG